VSVPGVSVMKFETIVVRRVECWVRGAATIAAQSAAGVGRSDVFTTVQFEIHSRRKKWASNRSAPSG
jgi:hypothetical protein